MHSEAFILFYINVILTHNCLDHPPTQGRAIRTVDLLGLRDFRNCPSNFLFTNERKMKSRQFKSILCSHTVACSSRDSERAQDSVCVCVALHSPGTYAIL